MPEKTIARMIINKEELGLHDYLEKTMMKVDMTFFLKGLWNNLFSILSSGIYPDNVEDFYSILELTTTPSLLTKVQAFGLFDIVLKLMKEGSLIKIPKGLQKNLRLAILRFADQFDIVQSKYVKTDTSSIESLIEQCQIQPHEIGEIVVDMQRKRRRRTSSTKSQTNNEVNGIHTPHVKKQERLENLIGKDKRTSFMGPPVDITVRFNDRLWDEAVFMLESFKNPRYLAAHRSSEFQIFALRAIAKVTEGNIPIVSEIRTALSLLPITADFANQIITRSRVKPASKKVKALASPSTGNTDPFKDETDAMYEKRLTFGLEILNANNTYDADVKLFVTLFEIIEK